MKRVLLVCAIAACANHHPSGDDTAGETLTINPPTSELMILNGAAATEDFTATLTHADGTTEDVTANTTFAIDATYGAFSAATLSMNVAGKAQVTATAQGVTGTAEVIARLKSVRFGSGVDPNAPSWFSMPEDSSHAPSIAYPPVGVIVPRNLGDLDVHWIDASSDDTFEISLVSEFADVRAYVHGGNGLPDATASWIELTAQEWTDAAGADSAITIDVRGVNSANPVTVGSAPAQTITLSNEPMLGGLYYWSTASASGVYGIFRHDMSLPGQPAQEYMTTDQTAGRCVACHVLSSDGKEMAVTFDGGGQPATMVDVATTTQQPVSASWNFGTFTPDGTQFLSVEAGVLVVRDYATQAVIVTAASDGWITHPDLSPDGTELVYVRPTVTNCDWAFGGGQIYTRSYDQTTHAFGVENLLVADASNNYYPSWSPDGQWIVFNKSSDNSGNGAYNNPSASLWVIAANGQSPAIELAAANSAGANLTNSWGRWAPFAQTVGAGSEPIYWITTSSKRDFGTRLVGAQIPQIWMTPFFPGRAAAGQDPSAPAFWLPFQAIDSRNHIAQWTQHVVTVE